ncbi:MAG: class I SAM-dependent methyltransferase [Treponema sp.]|jgi:2-polyprenyl-3-methyl-5-hydroxy-6-metoxy-1,4-benzoquinol methylase|nr:class I SAM-dependent methyltransferase [Treponema sp.]
MRRGRAVKTWSTPVIAEESRIIPCALCGGRDFRPAMNCEGFSYVRCAGCGLVQMNPQPEAAEVARRYQEGHGGDYLSYELANEETFLKLQQLALGDAHFDDLERELMAAESVRPAGPRILDIGCATGALLLYLHGRGWDVTGVEISPSAGYARDKRGLDVRSLPLEECRFPGGAFDVVLASHLIEHLNAPAAFVEEVHRLLRPGGRFFVTTPNIAGLQAQIFGWRWRSAIFDHLYLFSVKTLSALLGAAGFSVEGVYTWGGLAAGIAPAPLKRIADRLAKPFGFGDVMLVRAEKAAGAAAISVCL